jgi:hypothetical protein
MPFFRQPNLTEGIYVVRKNAEAYQPTSFKEWKWSEILGIAVATIV